MLFKFMLQHFMSLLQKFYVPFSVVQLSKNKCHLTTTKWRISVNFNLIIGICFSIFFSSMIRDATGTIPKFPELYSGRINSLIITALKYMTKQESIHGINCHFGF